MKYYAATANQPKLVLYSPQRSPGQYPLRAPLPLIAVSAFVQKKCSVCIVDNNLYQRPVEKVLEECRDAVCLGITALTSYQITDGLKVAKLVRDKYPRLPIVWGGWHPTLEPEGTIKSTYVDIVVRRRGERTLDELVDCLVEGKGLDRILGISYKRDEQVFHTPDRPLEDINALPPMPYQLIDMSKVLYQNWYGSRAISYVSSYGCPWGCGFCADQTAHNRRWSGLSPFRMVEEIEKLNKDYGVDAIVFEDSNFFVNKERVRQFCEELIKRGLGIRYGNVNGHIRQLLKFEEEMWDLLVRSGCTSMLIGAESGYQPALDLMNKGLRVEETIELAEKCRDKKIKLSISVLWGLPWDPDYEKTRRLIDTEVRHTIDLLDKVFSINPRNKLLFAIYTPYPGSPLYSRSLGLGLEPPQTLDGWASWVLQERNTPWVTHQQEGRVKMLHPYIFPFIDPDSYPLAMGMFHNRFVKLIAKVPYKMFRLIARLRWKFKFFTLPIDYYLFKLYLWVASKLRLPSA